MPCPLLSTPGPGRRHHGALPASSSLPPSSLLAACDHTVSVQDGAFTGSRQPSRDSGSSAPNMALENMPPSVHAAVLGLRVVHFLVSQTNMPFLSIYLLALEQDMEHGTSVLQAANTLQHQTFLQVRDERPSQKGLPR